MPKCTLCSWKAEFYSIRNGKKAYYCEEHARELLLEGEESFLLRA